MPRHEEHLGSEALVRTLIRQINKVHVAVIAIDRVDFHSHIEIACDRDHLRLVTLNIELLDLPHTEGSNIAHEIFEQYGILFQISCGHESRIHDDVVGLLMIAHDFHAVGDSILFFDIFWLSGNGGRLHPWRLQSRLLEGVLGSAAVFDKELNR